jgi:hypothetical protein
MKKSQALYVLIPLLAALAIRLYPTLISGMPFSTDGWPLIKNAVVIVQNSPIPLSSSLLDSYNSFWPTISIFGAILSEIMGLSTISSMAIGIPIVAALTIPIFYLLVKKLTQNSKIAVIAAFLLATAFPYTLLMAGVTKETFASPLYISLVLIFLLEHNWKTTALFSAVSVVLVLTHHLTAFLTVGIIAAITVASYISKDRQRKINSTSSNLMYTGILTGATALYLGIFTLPALLAKIAVPDLLSVGAYQFLALSTIVYIMSKTQRKSTKRMIFDFAGVLLIIIAIMVVITNTSLLPTAPVVPVYYLLFGLPFLIALPVVSIGINSLYLKKFALLAPLLWLVPIVAFASYGIFANPAGGLTYAVRSINFLLPPLMVLVAIGLYKFYRSANHHIPRTLTVFIVCSVVFSIAIINVSTVYATVSLQEPYLGYFWRYEPSEYKASNWLSTNLNNQTVSGDFKAYYLIDGYFGTNVDITSGLNYLQGNGSAPPILYIYNQMKANGYVLYEGIPRTLPPNWTDKLSSYNCVYANSEVTIYARR